MDTSVAVGDICGKPLWLAQAQFETSGIVDEPRQISMRADWCAKKEKLHLHTSAGRLWIAFLWNITVLSSFVLKVNSLSVQN